MNQTDQIVAFPLLVEKHSVTETWHGACSSSGLRLFKFFKYTEGIMRNTTAALFGLVLQVVRVQVYLY